MSKSLLYLTFALSLVMLGACGGSRQAHAIAARSMMGQLGTVVEEPGHSATNSVEVLPAPPEHAKRIGYLRIYPGPKPCGEDVPEDATLEGERIGASFVVFTKGHFGACRAEYFAASSP